LNPAQEKRGRDLELEIKQLKRFQVALVEQNASLIEQLNLLKDEVARQGQLIEILKRNKQKATQQLAKLVPLKTPK
jgi:hypothetical protein